MPKVPRWLTSSRRFTKYGAVHTDVSHSPLLIGGAFGSKLKIEKKSIVTNVADMDVVEMP